MLNTLKNKIKDTIDRATGPSLEILKSKEGVSVTDKVGLFDDLRNTVRTISDDPGNHKKKALLGMAGTIGGAYATGKYYNQALKSDITKRLGRGNGSSGVPGIISALLAASTPAAIYYTVQNRDRGDRFALGLGATGATLIGHNIARNKIQSTGIPPETMSTLMKANASVLATAGSGLYTLHQLQAASDEAKLKALEADDTLSDVEKAKQINNIRSRKDFLTRYPAFRYAPYSEKLRSVYNQYHQPEPVITPADADRFFLRTKIRE